MANQRIYLGVPKPLTMQSEMAPPKGLHRTSQQSPISLREPTAPAYEKGSSRYQWLFKSKILNDPQADSMCAASLVFLAGGMAIAWAFGYTGPLSFIMTTHLKICWFIAAIIGSICSALAYGKVLIKIVMVSASYLILLAGVLLTAFPKEITAIAGAQYINGFACGLIFVTTLGMAGEESISINRGMNTAAAETLNFISGFWLQTIYASLWNWSNVFSVNVTRWEGVLFMIIGFGALLAALMVIESPVYFLMQDQEAKAVDALRRLQRPSVITHDTFEQLWEHKRYIAANNQLTFKQSVVRGLSALMKLCLYRFLVALSFSFNMATTLEAATVDAFGERTVWTCYASNVLRWLATVMIIVTLDSTGRKIPMLSGSLICSVLAFAIGIIIASSSIVCDVILVILHLMFAFSAGVFIPPSSSYLSEAFPLAVKPYFICIAFIVEMLVHIAIGLISVNDDRYGSFFMLLGILHLIFFIFGYFCMPETKGTNLREAQNKF